VPVGTAVEPEARPRLYIGFTSGLGDALKGVLRAITQTHAQFSEQRRVPISENLSTLTVKWTAIELLTVCRWF
jgi:hypothetical protein